MRSTARSLVRGLACARSRRCAPVRSDDDAARGSHHGPRATAQGPGQAPRSAAASDQTSLSGRARRQLRRSCRQVGRIGVRGTAILLLERASLSSAASRRAADRAACARGSADARRGEVFCSARRLLAAEIAKARATNAIRPDNGLEEGRGPADRHRRTSCGPRIQAHIDDNGRIVLVESSFA